MKGTTSKLKGMATIDLTDSPEPSPQRGGKRHRPDDQGSVSSSGAAGCSLSSGGEGERISSLVAALLELVPDASPSRVRELAREQPSGISREAAVESALSRWYGEQSEGGGRAPREKEEEDKESLALAQKMQQDEWEGAGGGGGGGGGADVRQVSADSALAASMQDDMCQELDSDIARKLQVRNAHPRPEIAFAKPRSQTSRRRRTWTTSLPPKFRGSSSKRQRCSPRA